MVTGKQTAYLGMRNRILSEAQRRAQTSEKESFLASAGTLPMGTMRMVLGGQEEVRG